MGQKQGGALLRAWLRDERRTQDWLGEQIGGAHQTNVSAWIRGRAIPLEAAIAIERLTGIKAEDWLVDAISADESGEHPAVDTPRTSTG